MDILFKINTISYIIAEFKSDQNNIEIGHSGLYEDKFQELLNEFYLIYKTLKGKPLINFPHTAEILWKDDFIHYKWVISINSSQSEINIKIIELYTSNPKHYNILINENFSKEKLYDNIYSSLHQMYINHGIIGYKYNWDVGNFPIAEYLLLKADKFNLELPLKKEEEEEEWKNKICEEDELNVLIYRKE